MNCPECGKEMKLVDTTVSNIDTERASRGEHTGDIYHCEDCDASYLYNMLTGELEYGWHG